MIGVLEQFGWLVLTVVLILGFIRLIDWAGGYYANPDEPTLLDAPHVAEKARQAARAAEPEDARPSGERAR